MSAHEKDLTAFINMSTRPKTTRAKNDLLFTWALPGPAGQEYMPLIKRKAVFV
ncbi:MAG TPA: hypothetical protein DEB17_02145 [Chlorobaculum sp.]|uniref:Uncharacterized protein n=1 Tax=Chlorobaculum tepidum (strain ATCC 49652 / DSM 12025 / NBRC 103806 / TLS) TaxID=194439 RepID=Q8KEL1_CHLTE|nr:hypothetical protein CT0677 [Chlorobaculum tepidum TLS]HBU22800.1 hypothetical protein [Chlorobaculum sp.]